MVVALNNIWCMVSGDCPFCPFLSKKKKKIKELLNLLYLQTAFSFAYLNKLQLRQLHVQEFLGQSNLISISQRDQSVLKQPCSMTPPHAQTLYSFPLFQSHNDPFPHSMPWHFHAIQLPCLGGVKEAWWLKNNLFKNYYMEKEKKVIPLRQPVWLTPVRGMINDSIFCLCCLLPLAAVAIYHHPLSAVESSSDSASQQTFSTHSHATRGNYYCQNNNGLA